MRKGGMGGAPYSRGYVFDVMAKGVDTYLGGGVCFLKSERLFDEIQYILARDLSLQSTGVTGAKIYSKFIRVRHSLDDKILKNLQIY